jgi:hypothetical protein
MKKFLVSLGLCLLLIALITTPVLAAKPAAYFFTRVTSDGITLPGTLQSQFIFNTQGVPNTFHYLGVTDTKANPVLNDGLYPFCLAASSKQIDTLCSYFYAKMGDGAYYDQIKKEIYGFDPFFYLQAQNGQYFLIDGFTYALSGNMTQLRIDDDYPVGKYVHNGALGVLSDVSVNLKVMRWDTGFSTK